MCKLERHATANDFSMAAYQVEFGGQAKVRHSDAKSRTQIARNGTKPAFILDMSHESRVASPQQMQILRLRAEDAHRAAGMTESMESQR